MKKQLSCLLLVSSGAAFFVRLMQMLFGFEAETDLPLRGSVWGLLVPAVLAVLAIVWWLAVRRLPAKDSPTLAQAFPMTKNGLLLPVAGSLLLGLSGLVWLATGLLPATANAMTADGTLVTMVVTSTIPPATMVLLGILGLLLALVLFLAAVACRVPRKPEGRTFPGALLLAAPVCLVVRVVLIYRIHSVDPSLSHYAVELLAMVCLTVAFYRLSAFGCGVGGTRSFLLYGGWAVMLSLATLSDGHSMPDLLFYLGGALTLLGLIQAQLTEAVPTDDPS